MTKKNEIMKTGILSTLIVSETIPAVGGLNIPKVYAAGHQDGVEVTSSFPDQVGPIEPIGPVG